ncbi:MAG TPA: tetratricopeptide repeat protein, partial [Egibacteraceae bacterium]|nr:tetratricopeptide repeat protein [Egibacteraceae bacterium]
MTTAKLLPPAVPPSLVARPALMARLDDGLSRRLTTVVAGAGFGKSTLLSAWIQQHRGAWYTLDSADSDLNTFARGMLASLRRLMPDMSTDLDAAVSAAQGPEADAPARADAVAASLAEVLHDQPAAPLLIVLDDLHELSPETGAVRLIEALCRQTPAWVHIAVTSRAPLPFGIQRWRGRGEVLEMDSTALAFTSSETAQIAQLVLGGDGRALAEALHRRTGGWPAAVRLACEALRHRSPPERAAALAELTDRAGPLTAYLLEEVLSAEPEPVRALLSRMALLEQVSPTLCAHLGVPDAARILSDLQRRGLVLARSGGGGRSVGGASGSGEPWYELNALVRDGVAAAAVAPDGESQVVEQAAEWFAARGDVPRALRCLMRSGSDAAIAALLSARGSDLVAAGEVRPVASAAERLPADLRTADIELVEGEARLVLGEWDQALERFQAAGGDSASLDPGLAWRMGLIHHLRGDGRGALSVYQRGAGDPARPRDTALLLAWTAAAHWLCGQVSECRELAGAALETAADCRDDDALVAAHTALAMLAAHDGDRRANRRHYQLALEAATRSGNVIQRIRIHSNRGSHSLEEGRYDEAEEQLEIAIRLAELTGHPVLHGLALANRADARLGAARLEEATADLRAARAILERVGSSLVVYPLRLGDAYALRGELALARAAYEDAAALAEQSGDHQGLAATLAGLARVIAVDDPAAAQRLAERALDVALGVQRPAALLALGWAAVMAGDLVEGLHRAESAAAEARARWDRAALAQSLELQAAADPKQA